MALNALQGWHPGEIAIQRKLGFDAAVKHDWARVANFMPEQHRIFHSSNISFIPLTTIDGEGRPWGAIVSGTTGDVGFIHSPSARSLNIHTKLWKGDPLLETLNVLLSPKLSGGISSDRRLTAGLGIEFSTRRRNKLAGVITDVKALTELKYQIDVAVTETLGNCPKYINVRELVSYPYTRPDVAYHRPKLLPDERLPDEVIEIIHTADTIFMASIYRPEPSIASTHPAHAGMNARSGLPGFVRVRPSDGRTVVIPDYSGNRFVSSLGNIESTGLAGLTFVSFDTGDVLYLTGTAENHVGESALGIMARHASLTTVRVTGYTLVRDALPVRQKEGTHVERSPYSPKVKYLVEETVTQANQSGNHSAHVQGAVQLSPDLAVLRFGISADCKAAGIKITPGQSVVLDFMDWIGPPRYQHMADAAPESINDDRVRTWTVSSAHENESATWFEITMRRMPGGTVTGALFNLLEEHGANSNFGTTLQLDGSVSAGLVGVTGDFVLSPAYKLDVLWIAGGIGLTPFLAMLQALKKRGSSIEGDIWLVLSTREPDLMLKLIHPSLKSISAKMKITLHLFTSEEDVDVSMMIQDNVTVEAHPGRVGSAFWKTVPRRKEVFVCGPNSFGDATETGLQNAGVLPGQIHREGFY